MGISKLFLVLSLRSASHKGYLIIGPSKLYAFFSLEVKEWIKIISTKFHFNERCFSFLLRIKCNFVREFIFRVFSGEKVLGALRKLKLTASQM